MFHTAAPLLRRESRSASETAAKKGDRYEYSTRRWRRCAAPSGTHRLSSGGDGRTSGEAGVWRGAAGVIGVISSSWRDGSFGSSSRVGSCGIDFEFVAHGLFGCPCHDGGILFFCRVRVCRGL